MHGKHVYTTYPIKSIKFYLLLQQIVCIQIYENEVKSCIQGEQIKKQTNSVTYYEVMTTAHE